MIRIENEFYPGIVEFSAEDELDDQERESTRALAEVLGVSQEFVDQLLTCWIRILSSDKPES